MSSLQLGSSAVWIYCHFSKGVILKPHAFTQPVEGSCVQLIARVLATREILPSAGRTASVRMTSQEGKMSKFPIAPLAKIATV